MKGRSGSLGCGSWGVVVFSMCLNWMEWLQVEYALSTPSM